MKASKCSSGIIPVLLVLLSTAVGSSLSIQQNQDVIVSQKHGKDDATCGIVPSPPCKTISMGVWLATHNARVRVDGTGSDVTPYTCKSHKLTFPGIYLNKSVSIIGVNATVYVKCQEGFSIRFDKSLYVETKVSLTNITFIDSSIDVHDIGLDVDGCVFTDVQQAINVQSARNVTLSFNRSTCENTSACLAVTIAQTKEKSISNVKIKVTNSNIVRSWSKEPYISSDKASGIHVTSIGEYDQSEISSHIVLQNVKFCSSTVGRNGLILVNLKNANTSIILDKVVFLENKNTVGATSLITIVGSFFHHMKILNTQFRPNYQGFYSAVTVDHVKQIVFSIANSTFTSFNLDNNGVLYLKSDENCTVSIVNTTFTGNDGSRNTSGGCLSVFCPNASVFLNNSLFSNISTRLATVLDMAVEDRAQLTIHGSNFTSNTVDNQNNFVGVVGLIANVKARVVIVKITECTIDSCSFVEDDTPPISVFFLIGCQKCWPLQIRSDMSDRVFLVMQGVTVRNSGSLSSVVVGVVAQTRATIIIQDSIMYNGRGGVLAVVTNNSISIDLQNTTIKNYVSKSIPSLAVIGFSQKGSLTLKIKHSEFNSVSMVGCLGVRIARTNIDLHEVTFEKCVASKTVLFNFLVSTITIHILSRGKVSIKSCKFIENANLINVGGAFSFVQDTGDTIVKTGCMFGARDFRGDTYLYRKWQYNTHITIKDSTFINNVALFGGALALSKGSHYIENCSFVDNFAKLQGGHIFVDSDSTQLVINDSSFRQDRFTFTVYTLDNQQTVLEKEKGYYKFNFNDAGVFISSNSFGPLIMANSTLELTLPKDSARLVTITNGNYILINNDTEIKCSRGSELSVLEIPFGLNVSCTMLNEVLYVFAIQFACKQCPVETYSLQHGQSKGLYVVRDFQCLPCPFGADCHHHISARPNFWGYEVNKNPIELNFTLCPLGYCKQHPLDYNSCQDNRNGTLCGQCKENYSETLLSTSCRHNKHCNDIWFWFVVVLIVTFMALYLIYKQQFSHMIIKHILWFRITSNEDEHKTLQGADSSGGYLKIVFYFYQVANLLLINTSYNKVIDSHIVHPVIGFFNFQYRVSYHGFICPIRGLNAVSKQFLFTSQVIGVLFMIGVIFYVHYLMRKLKSKPPPNKGPYLGAILETLLLGYMVFATTSLQLLRCKSINGVWRLFISGDVVCYQWWQFILMLFLGIVILPFIITLALAGCCWLRSDVISVKEFLLGCVIPLPYLAYKLFSYLGGTFNPEKEVVQHDSRHDCQSEQHERYESQRDSRHDLQQDARDQLQRDSRHELQRDSRHEPQRDSRHESQSDSRHEPQRDSRHESQSDSRHELHRDSLHEPKRDSQHEPKRDSQHEPKRDSQHEPKRDSQHEPRRDSRHQIQNHARGDPRDLKSSVIKVLYGPFRDTRIYWESILISRRLLLIVIYVSVEDPLFKELLLVLVCGSILIIHIIMKPFHSKFANITESVSLSILVVIATINCHKASFLSIGQIPQGPQESLVKGLEIAQIVLLAIFPCLFILFVFVAIGSLIVRFIVIIYRIIRRKWSREYHSTEGDVNQNLEQPHDSEVRVQNLCT